MLPLMKRIGILIVDDSARMRDALKVLLQSFTRVDVAGTAGDGHEALEQVRLLKPDVVLMDIRMPRKNGLEATKAIKALPHPPKVIVVSADDGQTHRAAAAAAGADAFCSKFLIASDLLPAILSLFPADAKRTPPPG